MRQRARRNGTSPVRGRQREIQLSRDDANARGIKSGQTVTVSSNGTSVELRARIAKDLQAGVVRVARDHAADLHATVEVKP